MKVIVDGIATEYSDEGEGSTLVFLHGWASNMRTFSSITEDLKKDFRIVRLDLPGFGATEPPKGPWDIESYALFVSDFINKLNIKPYAVIGHSFGGRIIIKGIANKIFTTEKIILIGSAGVAKRKNLRNLILNIIAKIGKMLFYIPPLYFVRHSMRKYFYKMIGSDYLSAEALRMKEVFVNAISEDLSDYAKKISTPTLLIWGRDDTETKLKEGEKLCKFIQGSKMEVLDDAGHFVHEERASDVLNIMRKFL